MKYIIPLLLVLCVGCDHVSTNRQSIGLGSVREIRLSDGTQCAIITSAYGEGITCNWK